MYAKRIDANQNAIVRALRDHGAYVRIVTQGDGLPDILCAYKGVTALLEVKDGDKSPSHRKLTPAEEKFFKEWTGGLLIVVNSVQEALDVLHKIDTM
jgi:Holliday junction resolvase